MSELDEIARTVAELAAPGMKPKDLISAVRKHHPDASKKQISRAAFMAAIMAAEAEPDRARDVQAVALATRGGGEDADAEPRIPKRAPARREGTVARRSAR